MSGIQLKAKMFLDFTLGSARIVAKGDRLYYSWLGILLGVITVGVAAYGNQILNGLITSHMRDQVSWGFYIGNFAFLVGVAAAAVVLVIPAYVYNWGPIKEVVLLGELMAVAAIIMAMLFVTVDLGRPGFVWHLMPGLGTPNFPHSLLVWDVLVLNVYFVINYCIVTYLLFKAFTGQKYNPNLVLPLIFLSIPLAVSIHSVTAFLFMGLKARPYWHTAILAPRFLVSAFCSGPAILLLVFSFVRRFGKIAITDAALYKIAELLAYAMGINLFLLGCEVFTEFYAGGPHAVHGTLQWFGAHGRMDVPVYTWAALLFNVAGLIIFLVPMLRHRMTLLKIGCVLAIMGVYIEKGLGLLLPGLTPDALGEVYVYNPSLNELCVGAGIWGIGALLFTLMAKIALAINSGELRYRDS